MLDDDDDLVPLSFVGSATIDTPVERLIGAIRAALALQPSDLRAARNPDEAFRLLRSHAEQAGVFVLALGDLGSYHTELSVEVFRGFALTDEFAPFVVINPRDSAAARCFTLLHELVHLWISEPGISGGDPLDPVEVFCNNVASNFLLPDEELATLRVPGNEGVEGWTKAIRALAEPRNVSSSDGCRPAVPSSRYRQGSLAGSARSVSESVAGEPRTATPTARGQGWWSPVRRPCQAEPRARPG